MYTKLSNHLTPIVIQLTKLKENTPTSSQFSAPTITKISAMTLKTLHAFFITSPPFFAFVDSFGKIDKNIPP
jgi:hypothetical protein